MCIRHSHQNRRRSIPDSYQHTLSRWQGFYKRPSAIWNPTTSCGRGKVPLDALLAMGSLTGDKEYHEFAKLVCPSLSEGTISEIARHMDRFDDWPESYLLDTVIDYLQLSDEGFCFLLEQYVNPNIHHWRWSAEEERRVPIHNSELVEVINRYLVPVLHR